MAFMFVALFTYAQPINLIGQWKLSSVKNLTNNTIDSTFQNTGNLSIMFNGNNTYKCFLSVNTVMGSYITKGGFLIKRGATTKICCDDDKSMKFYNLLLDAYGYIFKESDLYIYSNNCELIFKSL
ncbi:MAG: META domain-containing protein [Bacteroidota bacterium]